MAVAVLLSAASPASATSINAYMMDTFPYHSFPPTAPYWSTGANAVQVFGQGSLGCITTGINQSQGALEGSTGQWVQAGYQTATEIAPQSGCGTLAAYESEIYNIANYMKSIANVSTKWGGFVLNEEPGYDFKAADLESLNLYTQSVMDTVPGLGWYWVEGQPNGWDLATYSTILESSWPSSEAYTSSMVNAINVEANSYGHNVNMLTIENQSTYPWDDYVWVANQVVGYNWNNCTWGCGSYFDDQYVYPYW